MSEERDRVLGAGFLVGDGVRLEDKANLLGYLEDNRDEFDALRAEWKDGGWALTIDGKVHLARCIDVSANRIAFELDGRTVLAAVAPVPGGREVVIEGRVLRVQERDESGSGRRGRVADEAAGDVTPPMPSEVVRVLVAEGDRVRKGQGLLVVSAMKMEMTLRSPRDGVVTVFKTAVGAKVMPGENLVVVEGDAGT